MNQEEASKQASKQASKSSSYLSLVVIAAANKQARGWMDAADAILELETLLLNMPCLLTCLDPSQKPAAGLQQAGD